MPSFETLKKKADKLLVLGDAQGNTAQGRRTLRMCGRYRRLARAKKALDKLK